MGLSSLIGALIGYAIAPWIIKQVVQFTSWIEGNLHKIPIQDIVSGAIGVIIGLIIAALLGFSFSRVPIVGPFFPLVFSVILGYLGWSVGVKNRDDIAAVFSSFPRLGKEKQSSECNKILDTSVIIDGRIADICKSGFIDGTLIIPGFVLEELQHIADSSDLLKRNRGRRGLDILNKIREELDIKVKIVEEIFRISMKLTASLSAWPSK